MPLLEDLLQVSAAQHRHLCPRQVLGVRMGLLGGSRLGTEVPQVGKRLLAIVETDGCAVDGIAVATGCRVGRRTMRIVDFGKVAVTLVDTCTSAAIRVVPHPAARERARLYAPEAETRWQAQLLGYQRMPDDQLLVAREVHLCFSLEDLLGADHVRTACERCGEEIINRREVCRDGVVLCQACAGAQYYYAADAEVPWIWPTFAEPSLPRIQHLLSTSHPSQKASILVKI